MKLYIFFILTFFVYSTFASDCPLTPKNRADLIKSSFYPVDDVKCVDQIKKWFISNKRFRALYKKLNISEDIKNSPYFVESISLNDKGSRVWRISNAPYLKKNEVARELASVKFESEAVQENKKEKLHILSAALYSGVASISSTDETTKTTEKAASNIGMGLSLSWTHLWSKRLSFFAVGSMKKLKFKVADNRTIDKADVTQSYIGVGLNFKVSDRFSLTPGLGIGESLLLTSSGNSTLSVDKVSISNASLGAKAKLFKFKSGFTLDLNGRYGHMLPKKTKGYDTKSGSYYQVGFGSSYNLNGKNLFINTNYTSRSMKVNDADQVSKDLGITAGVGWSF